jgi:branched-chain amino acid transport system permease protein
MNAEVVATLTLACLYAPVAIAVQLGMRSGGLSLAPIGWMAVGAYCAGLAATTWDVPLIVGWLVAAGIAAIGGPIVMTPVARVSGLYFALVSLAFVLALQALLSNLDYTGGALGIYGIPLETTLGRAAIFLALVCAGAAWMSTGGRGRRLRGAGQDAMAARTLGIDVFRTQLVVSSFGAVIAASSGVLYVGYVGYVDPLSYGFALVVQVLAMVIIGGRTHWLGAVIGAFLLGFLPLILRPLAAERDVVNGAVLIAVMVFLPGGLYSLGARLAALARVRRTRSGSPHHAVAPVSETAVAEPERSMS